MASSLPIERDAANGHGVLRPELFRLMAERDLNVAARFGFATAYIVLSPTAVVDRSAFEDRLARSVRRLIDLVTITDDGRYHLFLSHVNMPAALIVSERLKLRMSESEPAAMHVHIAGIVMEQVGEEDGLDELLAWGDRLLERQHQADGSRALVYSLRDLREEI
jgi:hypothetical protein